MELLRDLGSRYNEARVLVHLGDTHHRAGHRAAARQAWRHAVDILDILDHPEADPVRTRLTEP